jgi:hypothetical protein
MLKLPSQILEQWEQTSLRSYGVLVYRQLSIARDVSASDESIDFIKKSGQPSFFKSSFIDSMDADLIEQEVKLSIEQVLPDDVSDEAILLPPLFIRSNETINIEYLPPHVYLFAYESGPVVPVFTRIDADTLQCIIDLYSIVSEQFFNSQTAVELLHL